MIKHTKLTSIGIMLLAYTEARFYYNTQEHNNMLIIGFAGDTMLGRLVNRLLLKLIH